MIKSNVSNYKFTNLVEICPLCKDDLLFLPKKLATHIGNISRLVLVKNISNVINVIDPLTGQTGNIGNDAYWRDPFRPMITAARIRFTRYVVLGKDPIYLQRNTSKKGVSKKQRSKLALVTCARESDLGINDSVIEEQSHLGYLMNSGDVCLGYDLSECQVVDNDAEEARSRGKFPSVVFVRKLYGGVARGEADAAKKRVFQLQRLDIKKGEEDQRGRGKKLKAAVEAENMDEEDFMQELEGDRDMRTRVNIYKSKTDVANGMEDNEDGENEEDNEDDQKIILDELLDNLVLDSKPDADDEDMNEDNRLEGGPSLAAEDSMGYVGRDEALNVPSIEAAVPVKGNVWGDDFLEKNT